MWQSLKSNAGLLIILLLVMVLALAGFSGSNLNHIATNMDNKDDSAWNPPSLYYDASEGEERKVLAYGQDLIANTSKYFGPKGLIAQTSNGMNCQNCHLNAGRKSWGNNYSMVNAEYPKYRHRSGAIETSECKHHHQQEDDDKTRV